MFFFGFAKLVQTKRNAKQKSKKMSLRVASKAFLTSPSHVVASRVTYSPYKIEGLGSHSLFPNYACLK